MKSILLGISILILNNLTGQNIYKGEGIVSFVSEAPMETIKAKSTKLEGVVDLSKKIFAFSMSMVSFEGFNSALQKEHFNEHYLETKKFPGTSYTGTIISDLDCLQNCEIDATGKGKFTIHGVTQIEMIKIHLKKNEDKISINADFEIKLSDYNIKIPKIVQAKIANEIKVNVQILLTSMP